MIHWGDAGILPALGALIPLAGLLLFLARRRERRFRLLLDEAAAARLAPERSPWRARTKVLLRFLACGLVIVALARPQWGIRWQEARQRGLDILVVLDVSRSMEAADLRPSRLQRAKWGLGDLLKRLSGDRVGLVAFAGSSFLSCPLTADYAAFSLILEDLRPGAIPRGGTAIAPALETAGRSFEEGSDADRVVVLISDGEDHEGGIDRTAAALAEKRIRVFAVGVGTPGGDVIPAAEGERGPFLRDRSGAVVRTALREEALAGVAAATGGMYVRASAGDLGLDRIFDLGIAKLRRGEREAKLVMAREERFPWFLGAAVLLLALESLLGERRRRRPGPARRGGLVGSLVLPALLAAGAGPAAAGEARRALDEGSSRFAARDYAAAARAFAEAAAAARDEGLDPAVARYNQGCALLEAGKGIEAAATFSEALRSTDPALLAAAHYNRGNALVLAAGARQAPGGAAGAVSLLDEAIGAYEEAMRLDPRDEDPKVNHELATRERARLAEQARAQDPPGRATGAGDRSREEVSGDAPPPGRRREQPEKAMSPAEALMVLEAMRQHEASQRGRVRITRGEPVPVARDW